MLTKSNRGHVVHALDFDGTIHRANEDEGRYGDIGKNSALHQNSDILGYDNPQDFDDKTSEIRENLEISRGSEHAYLLSESSEADLSELKGILNESQYEKDIDSAYKEMCDEIYSRGNMVIVTTAGIKEGAEAALNGTDPEIIGAELAQDDERLYIEQFNGRTEKPYNVQQMLEGEGLEDPTVIAAGDSKTDEKLMDYALGTGGEAIAVEPGSIPYSSVNAVEGEYEAAAVIEVIFDELYSTGDIEKAERRASEFVYENDMNLPEVEPGPEWDMDTIKGLSIYERVKDDYNPEVTEVSEELEELYV